jgi:hypothetical protein
MLSEEQINKNAETVVKLVEKYVISARKTSIIEMLKEIGTQFYTAPASGKYHCQFPGGLVHHTLLMTKKLFELSKKFEHNISDESLLIAGLFHDLGKACTISKQDIYIWNSNQWRRDNLNEQYISNPEIRDGLTHAQRSIRLLTYFNVPLTDDEFQAILFHDGQYVDENKTIRHKQCKLGFLVHSADAWTAFFGEDDFKEKSK